MATVAFIPLRGGSKSIPDKNVKTIAGKPLVYWVLDAVIECNFIEKIYISTDSEKIKECIERYYDVENKIIVISRSMESAGDSASSEIAMLEFCNDYYFDEILFIQATSPLLKSIDLNNAYLKYKKEKYDSLLSVVNQKRFIWDNNGHSVNYDPQNRPRRQDWAGYYVENGAFYITTREHLLNTKCRISGKIGYYVMSEENFTEIDSMIDWLIVEKLLILYKKKIKLFLCDVDGCLTDAGMYYNDKGECLKKFNTHDGMGFSLLKEKDIKTGIITAEKSNIVKERAIKIKCDYVFMGVKDKLLIAKDLCKQNNITLDNVAYIGDDINDYNLLSQVGLAACPKNSTKTIKSIPGILKLSKTGGKGVVREFIEKILKNEDYFV